MHKITLTTAAPALSASFAPALAHRDDDDDNRFRGYSAHSRFHGELRDAHERGHEEGFDSRREHRAFHRALRYTHGEYHGYRPYYWWRRGW
jgi:hypothetical protein